MKKYFIPCLMLAASLTCMFVFVSCGGDDKDDSGSGGGATISQTEFVDQYFTVENGIFRGQAMPESTTSESIGTVEANDRALAGGFNYITVTSDQQLSRFLIGVDGMDGYMEATASSASTRADGTYTYIVPISYGVNFSKSIVMIIKAVTVSGDVTQGYRVSITFVESMEGELTINLTFDADKDLDLHLLTPSGKHIYWGDRTWTTEGADGSTISFGLDHDSNAACHIDHLNNENIVIPEGAIESGRYQIYLELYQNCDPNIDLKYQLAVRYKGNLVNNINLSAHRDAGDNAMAYNDNNPTIETNSYSLWNPVFGMYPRAHVAGTQLYVFDFEIRSAATRSAEPVLKSIYKPTMVDYMKMKDREEGIR